MKSLDNIKEKIEETFEVKDKMTLLDIISLVFLVAMLVITISLFFSACTPTQGAVIKNDVDKGLDAVCAAHNAGLFILKEPVDAGHD